MLEEAGLSILSSTNLLQMPTFPFSVLISSFQMPKQVLVWEHGREDSEDTLLGRGVEVPGGSCRIWAAWSCQYGDPLHMCMPGVWQSCVSEHRLMDSEGQDNCREHQDTCTAPVSESECTSHNQYQTLKHFHEIQESKKKNHLWHNIHQAGWQ